MLSESLKQTIRSAFECIKAAIPSFNNRYSQNKMIAEIAKTLGGDYHEDERLICIEAPTGVGKTIAYLTSAIPIAQALKKTLVISSANVALQEQLLHKDVPDIKRHSKLDFCYALVKGRSRYVCIRDLSRISEYDSQSPLFEASVVWDKPPEHYQIEQLTQMRQLYYNQNWDGDKDTLEVTPDNALWQKIAANRHTCSAKRCEFYNDCCFFKARHHINQADVIIANHDLVLADLSNNSQILPEVNQCIFIFDEAHHLADKALNHFALGTYINSIDQLSASAIKLIEQISKLSQTESENNELTSLHNTADTLNSFKKDFLALINDLPFSDDTHQFTNGVLDETFIKIGEPIAIEIKSIVDVLTHSEQTLNNYTQHNSVDALLLEAIQSNLALTQTQLIHWLNTINAFITIDRADSVPKCRWFVKTANDVQMNVCEIDISNQLTSLIWQHCAGAVLTSATLTSLSNFERLKQKTGLSQMAHCQYIRLDTPFDYSNVAFNIANITHQPNDDGFSDEIANQLLERLNCDEGSLVLFTSNQQMQYVAGKIEKKLGCTLYIQGEFSKQVILQKYMKQRDNNQGCIIFGLDSFAEGVDLPRHYCTHIVIVKLRFSVPTSPVEKATYDYLNTQGLNAFYHVSLPDASLRLIQACGRLIRTETDTGQITIFDRRLITKSYGKKLLEALPPYQVVVEKQ